MSENVKKANFFEKVVRFFKEVKGEMKKVMWPTWKQTVNNTMIVIAVILIVGVFLAIIDAIFGVAVVGVILGDFASAIKNALPFLKPETAVLNIPIF